VAIGPIERVLTRIFFSFLQLDNHHHSCFLLHHMRFFQVSDLPW
jgi:hypothetical protein